MAKLTWSGSWGFDLQNIHVSLIGYAYSYTEMKTRFVAKYDETGATRDEFIGTGFKYDSYGVPIGGTVTSYRAYDEGVKVGTFEGIKISVKSIVSAAKTWSLDDDLALFRKALSGNDQITGGYASDKLEGYAGDDALNGNMGDDSLYGGAGRDKLTGGVGADWLLGGSGADTFVFKYASHSTVALEGQDTIFDFSSSKKDKIDLKSIDANLQKSGNQTFYFIGTKDFTGKAGQLRYVKDWDGVHVYADLNGDKEADFAIFLNGLTKISKGDFFL